MTAVIRQHGDALFVAKRHGLGSQELTLLPAIKAKWKAIIKSLPLLHLYSSLCQFNAVKNKGQKSSTVFSMTDSAAASTVFFVKLTQETFKNLFDVNAESLSSLFWIELSQCLKTANFCNTTCELPTFCNTTCEPDAMTTAFFPHDHLETFSVETMTMASWALIMPHTPRRHALRVWTAVLHCCDSPGWGELVPAWARIQVWKSMGEIELSSRLTKVLRSDPLDPLLLLWSVKKNIEW